METESIDCLLVEHVLVGALWYFGWVWLVAKVGVVSGGVGVVVTCD